MDQMLGPFGHAVGPFLLVFHGQGRVQGAAAVFVVVRLKAHSFPEGLVGGGILVHAHEQHAVDIIPFIVPGVGVAELQQGAFVALLLQQLFSQALGFRLGNGMGNRPGRGGQTAQRFFVSQVQLDQLFLGLLLLLLVPELVGMAGLHLLMVRLAHLRFIGVRRKAQYL